MATRTLAPGGQTITAPLPPPPVRQFSFTSFSQNNPTAQQPGNSLDAEYDRSNNATSQLINFCSVTFNTDGTLKPGSVGDAQLDPNTASDIAADVEAEIQPLVDDATASANAALASANKAIAAADQAATQNQAAQSAASTAVAASDTATQASQDAVNAEGAAANSQTAAATSANDALGSANLATDEALAAQAWAEYMPDTIPPNILAIMNITGDHWSSRWWANQASGIVQDADNNLNDLGQQWVDDINSTGQSNQDELESQFHSYMTQLQSLYLGAFYYPPATDSFGNPVSTGALYYNLALQAPYVYNGSKWVPFLTVGPVQIYKYIYVATAGQTLFSGPDRNGNTLTFSAANNETVAVFHSKLLLTPTDDYAEGVNQITLSAPASAGDIVQVWVNSVPVVALDWQTVKVDTTLWTTTGGPLKDISGNPILPAAASDVFVSVNGVWQNAQIDYIVSSSTISFSPALEPDARVFATAIVPTVVQPPAQSAVTEINTASWVFDGTTTAFNLVDAGNNPITPTSDAQVMLSLNGVWQAATSDYTVSGSVLTFTTAPEADAKVFGIAGLP